MAYRPGTKSFVLNQLHVFLQELQNSQDIEQALEAVGVESFDDLYEMIEEVRDNEEEG